LTSDTHAQLAPPSLLSKTGKDAGVRLVAGGLVDGVVDEAAERLWLRRGESEGGGGDGGNALEGKDGEERAEKHPDESNSSSYLLPTFPSLVEEFQITQQCFPEETP
jgi:hypothetical protein